MGDIDQSAECVKTECLHSVRVCQLLLLSITERGSMNKIFVSVASGVILVGSVGIAALPSHAYDRDAFAYSASHFLSANQLPAAFASKRGININLTTPGISNFVCTNAKDQNKEESLTRSLRNSTSFYNVRDKSLGLTISVSEYKSNTVAEKAFIKLTTDIKKCDGNISGSYTDDSGTVYPYQNIVTSGQIPAVTVTGVQSIFTNEDSNNLAVGDQPAYMSDNMNIYTLVNNAIIVTEGTSSGAANLTTQQKRSLIKIANDMVTAWVN